MDLQQQFQKAQELRDNGQFNQSIDEYQHVRENALQANDEFLAAECLHMIGVVYYQQNEFKMAKDYFGRAIEAFQTQHKIDFISIVQRDQGLVAYKEKDYASAEKDLQESVQGLKETNLKGQLGISTDKLGVILFAQGQHDEGLKLIQQAIELLKTTSDTFFLSTAYWDLAKLQKEMGDSEKAKESASKSLEILNSFSNNEQFVLRRQEIAEFLAL